MKEEKAKRKTRSEKYEEKKEIKKEPQEVKKTTKKIEVEQEEITPSHPTLKKILLLSLLLLISFLLYSTQISTKIFETKEYKIESSIIPSTFDGIKIIQISDIHYGTTINSKELNKIVRRINKTKPDIVIFTGDLVDVNITLDEKSKKELIKILKKINTPLYKYAIYGDEDLKNKSYEEIMTSSEFKILNDTSSLLYYKDINPIVITGFKPTKEDPNYTILTDFIEDIDTTNLYKIALIHEPDAADKIVDYSPSIILSGHTMGGLIKTPFTKPIFLPEKGKKYYNDYYKIKNSELFISNGLGTSNLNIRINNHPSITLYRLYKTN